MYLDEYKKNDNANRRYVTARTIRGEGLSVPKVPTL